jgi:predicted tellurium resistance membrane protein TerC
MRADLRIIADLVMSLDNVVAIAAAAHGSLLLLILGLLISIPLIIYGSTLILSLVDRDPIIVQAGAALLGWIAGHIMLTDPIVVKYAGVAPTWLDYATRIGCAVLVLTIAQVVMRRRAALPRTARPVIDLAAEERHDRK